MNDFVFAIITATCTLILGLCFIAISSYNPILFSTLALVMGFVSALLFDFVIDYINRRDR